MAAVTPFNDSPQYTKKRSLRPPHDNNNNHNNSDSSTDAVSKSKGWALGPVPNHGGGMWRHRLWHVSAFLAMSHECFRSNARSSTDGSISGGNAPLAPVFVARKR